MIKKIERYPSIYFTLYDLDTQLECYRFGIYPFENRIDLIGYFYYLNNNAFQKIQLIEIPKNLDKKNIPPCDLALTSITTKPLFLSVETAMC